MFHLFDEPRASFVSGVGDDAAETDDFNDCPGYNDDWTLGMTKPTSADSILDAISAESKAPDISSWHAPTSKEVVVTVDKARVNLGEQAEAEFKFLHQKMVDRRVIPDDFISEDGTMKKRLARQDFNEWLTTWIYGPDSCVFRLFEDRVPCTKGKHALFARCLATYFYTCRYNEKLEELSPDSDEGKKSTINGVRGFATKEEYKIFWLEVADANKPKQKGRGTTVRQPGYLPIEIHTQPQEI
jgi:hypothetical protein